MEESEYNERVKRLREVNGVVAKLDPAIRSQAFEMLAPYVTGEKTSNGVASGSRGRAGTKSSPAGQTGSGKPSSDEKVPLPAFLAGRKLADNKSKATAIVVWSGRHAEQAELTVSDVKKLWKKTSYKMPANLHRDLQAAAKQGWLHTEGEGAGLKYSSVGYGEVMVDKAESDDE